MKSGHIIHLVTSIAVFISAAPFVCAADRPETDVAADALGMLYSNPQNPVIQRFALTGEFQLQWASGDSDRGSFGSRDFNPNARWGDIEVRRLRAGFESNWFGGFNLWGSMDVNSHFNPLYKNIYELALTYSLGDDAVIGIGKIKSRFFTREYRTRTRELITFEQSLLVNTLVPLQLTGTWIDGHRGNWVYSLAAYAGDTSAEFPRFDAGAVFQGGLGYDFASALGADLAIVRLDYQASTSAKNSDTAARFSNAFSLNTTYQKGRFYGYSDILGGTGRGAQGDVWGVVLTPTCFIMQNRLQAVLRYQYAHGDHDGLNLQNRYEALAPGIRDTKGAGSDYNAVYLGFNYYLHKHNFKIMTGVEYTSMTGGKKDFSGWTCLAGVRLAI